VGAFVSDKPDHVPAARVVDFDIYNPPGGEEDFHSAWKSLQDRGLPDLLWTPHNGGHWIATRNQMLNEVLGDFKRFASTASILPKSAYGDMGLIPVTLDPPAHRPFRMKLSSSLAQTTVRDVEPSIRVIANELIDGIEGAGHCDFITQYSTQFPVRVFMKMADLPIADAPMLKSWTDHMLRPVPDADWGEDVSGWRRGIRLFSEYLQPYINERRDSDRSDLLTRVLTGDIEGRPLTHEETLQMTVLIVLAGLDTVVNFLGFAMLHLSRSPEQCAELVADPALIPSAVEELLRRFPIVTMAREVKHDMEYDGVFLMQGDMIATPTPLGGLDERDNGCPMDVDFHRRSRQHATFGNGPHICPGSFLARTEIRITLEEWLKRIPEFSLAPDHQVSFAPGGVAGVNALPLVWNVTP
jgi:cytochrome P450